MRQLLMSDPRLIWSEVNHRKLLTTPEVIAEERAMIEFVKRGNGKATPLAPAHRIEDARLSEEQKAAVRHVLESRDRVTGIMGRAGVGKTMVLHEVANGIEEQGKRVVVVAPTAETAREVLRSAGFKDADTVASFLVSERLQERARNGVLVIDEAGLLSTRQMHRVFELASELNTRIVLVGDTHQHHAVDRGDALRLLRDRAELKLAAIETIRRQRGLYREVVGCLADGKVAEAFEGLDRMGEIHEIDDESRHRMLAERYVEGTRKGKSMLIVSPTHAEIRQVTQSVRESLQSQGRLRNQREIEVLHRLDLTEAQRESLTSYRQGQAVQFLKSAKGIEAGTRLEVVEVLKGGVVMRDDKNREMLVDVSHQADRFNVYDRDAVPVGLGERIRITQNGKTNGHRVSNGNLYTVVGFDERGGIKLEGGMTLAKDWCHFTHGYAVSSHASQGKTVDEVLLAIGDDSLIATNLEQFYVSVSRGHQSVSIFVQDREALFDAVQVSDRRLSALEMLDQKPLPELEPIQEPEKTKQVLGQENRPRKKLAKVLEQQMQMEQPIEMA
jgi:ATP-dependent exoDNAse (exonuclease V) alpha subunit